MCSFVPSFAKTQYWCLFCKLLHSYVTYGRGQTPNQTKKGDGTIKKRETKTSEIWDWWNSFRYQLYFSILFNVVWTHNGLILVLLSSQPCNTSVSTRGVCLLILFYFAFSTKTKRERERIYGYWILFPLRTNFFSKVPTVKRYHPHRLTRTNTRTYTHTQTPLFFLTPPPSRLLKWLYN